MRARFFVCINITAVRIFSLFFLIFFKRTLFWIRRVRFHARTSVSCDTATSVPSYFSRELTERDLPDCFRRSLSQLDGRRRAN